MSRPGAILFLCVANSARSQLAEGIARALAPPGVKIYSAGSDPGTINPLAVQALAEIGVDASSQRSKGLAEVPVEEMDLVVTLCAEEVCPALPRKVRRVHWPLPDPAAELGESARLDAFRRIRDELLRRIPALFQ